MTDSPGPEVEALLRDAEAVGIRASVDPRLAGLELKHPDDLLADLRDAEDHSDVDRR